MTMMYVDCTGKDIEYEVYFCRGGGPISWKKLIAHPFLKDRLDSIEPIYVFGDYTKFPDAIDRLYSIWPEGDKTKVWKGTERRFRYYDSKEAKEELWRKSGNNEIPVECFFSDNRGSWRFEDDI